MIGKHWRCLKRIARLELELFGFDYDSDDWWALRHFANWAGEAYHWKPGGG